MRKHVRVLVAIHVRDIQTAELNPANLRLRLLLNFFRR